MTQGVHATLLGTIQDVRGATVGIELADDTLAGLAFVDGLAYRIGQIGSFVRIPMGYLDLFAIISQVGASAVPASAADAPGGRRWITAQLVGETTGGSFFARGVSQFPTIGDRAFLVTEGDLAKIYGNPDLADAVSIGELAGTSGIPALVDLNALVLRHSAVLGATGSGKSTTVSSLLSLISDQGRYPSARVLIVDVHGEYASAFRGASAVFSTSRRLREGQNRLLVPYWAMNSEELLAMTFGPLDGAERGAVLDAIVSLKREAFVATGWEGLSADSITADTPVPFSIHRLWLDLHRIVNSTHMEPGNQTPDTQAFETDETGNPIETGRALDVVPPRYRRHTQARGETKIYLSNSTLKLTRPLEALASRLRDPRFDFLFGPSTWRPDEQGVPDSDLDSLLDDWLGDETPITILDISGVPPSIASDLVGALTRILIDAMFWSRDLSEGARETPLLLVLDEAHRYVGAGETGAAAQAIRRIAREGRKYGIGLMLVSQRPSEVDSTVLAQCGTLFAMRLSNETDQSRVSAAASDTFEGLLSMLPSLRTGEAVIVGEAVKLPIRARIALPVGSRRPDSRDPKVVERDGPGGWNRAREPHDYGSVVRAWRSTDPGAGREEFVVTRQPVDSSSIASVGYDPGEQVLEVEFKENGDVYQYLDVPEAVYLAFVGSESLGQFLNGSIKGAYRYRRA